MKAGNFNINDYLEKLYENADENITKADFMDGGEGLVNSDGIVIPESNKKAYDWLKSEFQKGRVEVKVEMNIGGAKFEPGYDLQTDLDSIKDFKPGMFGEVVTKDGENKEKGEKTEGNSLDTKKEQPGFTKGEGEGEKKPGFTKGADGEKPKEKGELFKTKSPKDDIKDKESTTGEDKEEPENKKDKSEVKKIDLKTKK